MQIQQPLTPEDELTKAKQLADDLEKFGGVFERRRKALQLQYQQLIDNIFEANLKGSLENLTSNQELFSNWEVPNDYDFQQLSSIKYYLYRRECDKYELLEQTLTALKLCLGTLTDSEYNSNEAYNGDHQLFKSMVALAKSFKIRYGADKLVLKVYDKVGDYEDANN